MTALEERGLRPATELAAGKPHGTRLRYIAGCKCFHCRRANSDYERGRKAARLAGDWNGFVPADKARAHLMSLSRRGVGKRFASHSRVNHSRGEYGRGEVYTNTIEGFFSVFKRGMKGVYQHCDEKHLHRYLAEFDFRYNHRSSLGVEDGQRVIDALAGIEGKRLTYRSAD